MMIAADNFLLSVFDREDLTWNWKGLLLVEAALIGSWIRVRT
jgi:hypothetical protein